MTKRLIKKTYLKRNVQNVLEGIVAIIGLFLLMTIESEWTLNYLKFVTIVIIIMLIPILIIKKFGRKVSD